MRTSENEDLSDFELSEMLMAWSVPDPPQDLRSRVFSEKRNSARAVRNPSFEISAGLEEPWYRSLIGNLKGLIRPTKLPPLEVTSKPVEVGSIWGAYASRQSRYIGAALLVQTGTVALVLAAFPSPATQNIIKRTGEAVYLAFYHPRVPASQKARGGGGGGQLAARPVAKGVAPKFADRQFVPPAVVVPMPRLPAVPTISARAPQIDTSFYGDPLSKLNNGSPGPGINGLGDGKAGGLGSGNGDGLGPGEAGGSGGGVYRIGGDVSSPLLILKIEPEYSEEARKARYSGVVKLSVVVDEHGIPRDIRVVEPLGLGLDEKAIEAVARWRFRPGMKNGKPVSVLATVEVSFRLL